MVGLVSLLALSGKSRVRVVYVGIDSKPSVWPRTKRQNNVCQLSYFNQRNKTSFTVENIIKCDSAFPLI